MKINYLALAAILSMAVFARPAHSEYSVGAAQDISHAKNTNAFVARYDNRGLRLGGQALVWSGSLGTNGAAALDYNLGYGPVDLNLGAAYIVKISEINGTQLNMSLTAGLNLGAYLKVQFIHLSNGQKIFRWSRDRHNLGWNFLGILYKF